MIKKLASLSVLLMCISCAQPSQNLNTYFYLTGINSVEPNSFDVCHEYGCQRKTRIEPAEQFWQQIGTHFTNVKTAENERNAIANSIQDFEIFVGKAIGTNKDVHGTYIEFGAGQQDCVDESINTSVYLTLMDKRELLQFHDVTHVERRGPRVTGNWWHQTATIQDRANGNRYAVDSWFEDNGYPAYVVPMDIWHTGWLPENPVWKQSGKYEGTGY